MTRMGENEDGDDEDGRERQENGNKRTATTRMGDDSDDEDGLRMMRR
jgi:hypothetical protein